MVVRDAPFAIVHAAVGNDTRAMPLLILVTLATDGKAHTGYSRQWSGWHKKGDVAVCCACLCLSWTLWCFT